MTTAEIIRNNLNEIDAEDFTTLMPSIPYLDDKGWQNLAEVLHMLGSVGVEPFKDYSSNGIFQAVCRGKEVFRPTNKSIGVMYSTDMQKASITGYEPILEALGISITKGLLKSSLSNLNIEVYILYITKEGLGDKPQYWENILGYKWEEIKQ